ncbi:hypothetical protein GPLA_4575 [Paraglaciecola polaris LMG 21857]|uniref:Uncharacterized protein n=1 Tax=Paraglaciecola polaris LMG 21857 TaxID=1129793 RepID=K6YRV3_9ALTE|nr:hypothetical protein GPLA_4575 [Paraglaciecola polaris LMG 21857]
MTQALSLVTFLDNSGIGSILAYGLFTATKFATSCELYSRASSLLIRK